MISSIVNDNDFVTSGVPAQGALAALDIFDEIFNGYGSFDFGATAARIDVRHAPDDVNPWRLADVGDHFNPNRHSTLPLLNTTEQPGSDAGAGDSGKALIRINVPFLPTAFPAGRTAVAA